MNDVQKCILDIFKEVAGICKRNEIPYYAIGGTCIGAARHNGFIPWDDDLDIAVPIEDFKRLREALTEELPNYYNVHDSYNKKQYHYVFMKVQDDRTTFIQDSMKDFADGYMGVFVDIMPLAGVPSEKNARSKYIKKLTFYQMLNVARRFPSSSLSSIKGRVASRMFKSLTKYNYFSNKYLRCLEKHPVNKTEFVGYVWSPPDIERWTFPKEWFEKTKELPFEDTVMSCPWKYQEYLTQQFGDYMTPPPKDEQVSPHEGYLDLKHSYKEYQNGTRIIK